MADQKPKVIKKSEREQSIENLALEQRRHELGLLKILLGKYFPQEVPKLFPKPVNR